MRSTRWREATKLFMVRVIHEFIHFIFEVSSDFHVCDLWRSNTVIVAGYSCPIQSTRRAFAADEEVCAEAPTGRGENATNSQCGGRIGGFVQGIGIQLLQA